MTKPNSEVVFDKNTGKPVGLTRAYRGMVGPVIYGTVPVPVSDVLEERIFARISSRESPMRAHDPTKFVFKDSGSIDGVQAYEPWVSAGAVHWISKNGNLQNLVRAYIDNIPEAREFFASCGYELSMGKALTLFKKGDEVIESDDLRNESFCIDMHYLLGLHFVEDAARRAELQAVAAKIQFNDAWRLVTDRDGILAQEDWLEPVKASPRLRLITADMAINMGTAWFRECLQKAEDFTPEALTHARVERYGGDQDDPTDNSWGKQRSNWILQCEL